MKIYILVISLLFSHLNSFAQDTLHTEKAFTIKSCKIIYSFDIGFSKGEKTIIFDDWGNIAKEYGIIYTDTSEFKQEMSGDFQKFLDTISLNKIPMTQHLLKIQTKGVIYNINLDTRTGYTVPFFKLDESLEWPDSLEKIIGIDTFLNKSCIVKEYGDKMKFWFWNNLILKKEMEENGLIEISEYATEIDESYVIKPDEFEVPKDVIIK